MSGASFSRLHHVQLSCPPGGEDAAAAFWVGALGFTRVPKPDSLVPRGGAWFRADPIRENTVGSEVLDIHVGVEDPFVPADRKAHVALLLSAAAELDGLADRLRSLGYDVESDALLPGYRRFYTHDPHGNRIEIMAADPPGAATPGAADGADGVRTAAR
jgi:catechol 2,3-dioxygenase-like lactoylglutathione lyase family enzyme